MTLLDDYVAAPALPAEGVTFSVTCRTAPGTRGKAHDVTLTADWQLLTPHDLAVERIALALGGTLTCLELADRVLPAARGLLDHLLRLVPAEIERPDALGWRVLVDVPRCRCEKPFPTAQEAAEHLREPRHWARRYGTTTRALLTLVRAIGRADALTPRRCPLPHAAADDYLTEPSGLDLLWAAGLPPSEVPALVARLAPHGGPVPTRVVLEHAYAPDDFAWVEQFLSYGPDVVAWAVRDHNRRDRHRPGERLAWLEAGLSTAVISAVFSGDAYTLTDAQAYAAATGEPFAVAARRLGRWQAAYPEPPSVRDLVLLANSAPVLGDVPPPAAARRVVELAADRGQALTDAQAALALAYCGTAPDAVARLATLAFATERGVAEPDLFSPEKESA